MEAKALPGTARCVLDPLKPKCRQMGLGNVDASLFLLVDAPRHRNPASGEVQFWSGHLSTPMPALLALPGGGFSGQIQASDSPTLLPKPWEKLQGWLAESGQGAWIWKESHQCLSFPGADPLRRYSPCTQELKALIHELSVVPEK